MLFDELPQIVRLSLYADNLRIDEMYQHLRTAEDAEVLRNTLTSLDLIAFIADGSVLPRARGVDPNPLAVQPIVPFQSPESLRVESDILDEQFTGDLASFRGCELAAALNRVRGFEVKQVPSQIHQNKKAV